MSNLLLLYGKREPTNIILERFFAELEKESCIQVKSVNINDISKDLLLWSDIVMGIRTQNIFEADIMHKARCSGRLVIEFIDDDFFGLKDFHLRRPLQKYALTKALSSSDIIMSSNSHLAKKMSSYAPMARCVVSSTAVDEDKIVKRKVRNTDILNVVYYSSDGCADNFDEVIKPMLNKLPSITKKCFHWHFFTVCPDLSETPYREEVTYYPSMSLNEFRKALAEEPFDIGIVPLVRNEYNSSKYVNKFFEYTQAGIPGIYSKTEPYEGFIDDNRTGIMCENNADAWLAGFVKMCDSTIRERIKNNSQDDLRIKFSTNAVKEKLLQDIPELEVLHKERNVVNGLKISATKGKIFGMIDPLARALGRIRTEGFSSTVRWTAEHYIFKIN